MAYADPNDLRLLLRLPPFTGDQEDTAELLIDLAEGVIDDETGQALEESVDTVILDSPTRQDPWPDVPGTGSHKLVLPRWPVTAVASVTILSDTGADEDLVFGTDYTWSAAGILTRVNGWWPTRDRSVQAIVTAGYNPVPKNVRRITLRLAATAWANPLMATSESLGDHSIAFTPESLGMALSDADRKALGIYKART